jgi:hypothetical protein
VHDFTGRSEVVLDNCVLRAGSVGNRIGDSDHLRQSRPTQSLHSRAEYRADDSRNDSTCDAGLRHRISVVFEDAQDHTNKSPFTISISSSVSGANAGDFTITGGTCGPSIAGNSSCTIGVKFKPTTAAGESATLTVSVPQDPASPHNLSLTGTGS